MATIVLFKCQQTTIQMFDQLDIFVRRCKEFVWSIECCTTGLTIWLVVLMKFALIICG